VQTSPIHAILLSVAGIWTYLTLMAALSRVWYTTAARLFSSAPCAAFYQQGRRWTDRSAGLIFIVFGTRLATDR